MSELMDRRFFDQMIRRLEGLMYDLSTAKVSEDGMITFLPIMIMGPS